MRAKATIFAVGGEGGRPPEDPFVRPGPDHVCFRVPDVDALKSHLEAVMDDRRFWSNNER